MKKLTLIILLSSMLFANIPDDKFKHMAAGVVVYFGCIVVGGVVDNPHINPQTCLIPVAVAGIGKELYDHQHPENHSVEFMDFGATMAIPLVGSIVLYKW